MAYDASEDGFRVMPDFGYFVSFVCSGFKLEV